MDDRKIIELFFARSERAIMELSNKYGSVCTRVAFNITPIKTDNTWETNGEAITDSAVIAKFYTEITKLTAHSFDNITMRFLQTS